MPDNGGAFKVTSEGVEGLLSEGYIGPRQYIDDPARPNLIYQRVQRWLIRDMARLSFAISPYPDAPWNDKATWLQYVAAQWQPGASVYAICLAEVYEYGRRNGAFLPEPLPAPTFPAIETLPGGGGLLAGGEALADGAGDGFQIGPKVVIQMDIGYYRSREGRIDGQISGQTARLTTGLARQADQSFVRVIDYDGEIGNGALAAGQSRTVEYWAAPDESDFTRSPILDPAFMPLQSLSALVNRYPWTDDRLYLAVIGCINFTGLSSPPEQPGEG